MLISSKEEGGAFNTNGVGIRDLLWDATDRFFLKFSKKNTLDNLNLSNYIKNNFKNLSTSGASNQEFLRNSDHSDLNRWLKRGWGTKEPLRLIKYTNILNDVDSLDEDLNLLRFRFNDNNQNIVGKDPNNVYFAYKQKRYGVRKKFSICKKFNKDILFSWYDLCVIDFIPILNVLLNLQYALILKLLQQLIKFNNDNELAHLENVLKLNDDQTQRSYHEKSISLLNFLHIENFFLTP
jgi:hypothetical protein